MSIIIHLDAMLAMRKITSKALAKKIGITEQNLSILKTGKAKSIRLTLLNTICQHLDCTPADLMTFQHHDKANKT